MSKKCTFCFINAEECWALFKLSDFVWYIAQCMQARSIVKKLKLNLSLKTDVFLLVVTKSISCITIWKTTEVT